MCCRVKCGPQTIFYKAEDVYGVPVHAQPGAFPVATTSCMIRCKHQHDRAMAIVRLFQPCTCILAGLNVNQESVFLTGTPSSAAFLMACSTAGVSSCFEFSSVPSTSVAISCIRGRSAEHMHLRHLRSEGATPDTREGLLKLLAALLLSPRIDIIRVTFDKGPSGYQSGRAVSPAMERFRSPI